MYKGKEIIGIIPARGGSKGILKKNIIDLGGYPLIAWTILRALKSKYIDRLIISSDNQQIIEIAQQYGCEAPFIRPNHLATDEASSVDVVLHVLDELKINNENQYFILLQPTSPLRTVQTIDEAIEFTIDRNLPYTMSVSDLDKSPYHIYFERENSLLEPLYSQKTKASRRQELPKAVYSNGVLYVMQSEYFLEEKSFRPKKIHYIKTSRTESIDIDTMDDLKIAQRLISTKGLKP